MHTTRTEIAEHVAPAFQTGAVSRDQLFTIAQECGAPPGVVNELRQLPDKPYRDLRDLWPELPGLPVA